MTDLKEIQFTFEGIGYQACKETAAALLDQYVKIKPENDQRPGLYINRTPGAYAIIDKDTLFLNTYVVEHPDLKANGEATGIKLVALLNLLVELANAKGWGILPSDEIGNVVPNDKSNYNVRRTGFTGASILE